MSWQEYRQAHQTQVGQRQDTGGNAEVPVMLRVFAESLFEFVDDFLVTVLHDKDIVGCHGGKAVYRQCEKDRFHSGIEPVMFDKMKIEGFE